MSSSIGGSSALNLALLNQLLQRAGATDQDTTDNGSATDAVDGNNAGQATGEATSFTAQTDALFTALDSDGDGKLSKSELRTGFQTLSQDMRSFLISQQDISGDGTADEAATDEAGAGAAMASTGIAFSTFASLDSDGDGTLSPSELDAGLAGSTAPVSGASLQNMGAGQLLERLLQAAGNPSSGSLFTALDSNGDGSISQSEFATGISGASTAATAANTGSNASATGSADGGTVASLLDRINSNGDDSVSSADWSKLLQDLQSRDVGEVANAPAMMRLQQSTNLDAALNDLLQAAGAQPPGAMTNTGV